ncbi:MAG: hypothetical protein K9L59_02815 [Desulfobacterales bacterium]|nr:hypothetical protein [Desulfobacterales bacterium]MCF8078702.1 hypothetical protein [Desulfobacterales bacterium]
MLEGFPDRIVQCLPFDMRTIPSNIDHLIVVVGKDKSATVFVNEVLFITDIEVKNGVKKGSFVRDEDILCVRSMHPDGVDIPDDAGFLVLFSVGWRKGLFFDFRPIQPKGDRQKSYDLPVRLAKIYSHMLFQNKFAVTAAQYRWMMNQRWFPFFSLSPGIIDEMLQRTNNLQELDGMLSKIDEFVDANITAVEDKRFGAEIFNGHRDLAGEAIAAYRERDWKRTIRTSGRWLTKMMQQCQFPVDNSLEATRIHLIDSTDCLPADYRVCSELLPGPFKKFLTNGFLRSIAALSDNSSAVLPENDALNARHFLRKEALLGILCLDQMAFFLSGQKKPLSFADRQS